jgi:hypothetical protein
MLQAGLDLSRIASKSACSSAMARSSRSSSPRADLDGLIGLVRRVDRRREPVPSSSR